MKINWGAGIAIFYTCFVVTLLSVVVFAVRQNVDLVDSEYYQMDVNYEDFRQKRANAMATQRLAIDYAAKELTLEFPSGSQPSGEVRLFRPSNSKLDRRLPLSVTQEGKMSIPMRDYAPGLWHVMVEWQEAGVSYYSEKKIKV